MHIRPSSVLRWGFIRAKQKIKNNLQMWTGGPFLGLRDSLNIHENPASTKASEHQEVDNN